MKRNCVKREKVYKCFVQDCSPLVAMLLNFNSFISDSDHCQISCRILTHPAPCNLESFTKMKISLNFYFHTSLRCIKKFYEGLFSSSGIGIVRIDTYNSLFLIFLNFTIISVLTTLMTFSALLTIMK